jgi:hypothetical protein
MASQCRLGDHVWELVRGGKREQCRTCETAFPCYHACQHLDCLVERGDPLPDWAACIMPDGKPYRSRIDLMLDADD